MTLADQKESLQHLLALHQQVLETAEEYSAKVVLSFRDLPLPLDLEDEEPWRLHPEAWKAWQAYQRNRRLCSRIREARLRFLSLMDEHPKYPEEWLTMEVRLPFRAEGNCVAVGPLSPKRIAKVCRELVSYRILPEKCKGCRLCAKVCPAEAITGEKKELHVIDQDKCIRCGMCLDKCPAKFDAVECVPGRLIDNTSEVQTHG